ncbi:MAG: 50S ribosomal protein L10 [Thermoplasmata archaeon]|nr:50S ribosomal protein L10 [Thermoplasmata archaeon]
MPGRSSVRPEKTRRVELLAESIRDAPVAALVGFRGVPAAAMQRMRKELRGRGHPIVVAPNSAIRHALQAAANERPSLRPLLDHVTDQTAVLVAKGNPFGLSRELDETRSPTPARGGELAPMDIVVPGGTTSFKPGPIVGELQQAGFPAAIEKGKVVLKKDTTIVRAGQPIPRNVATLLTRLDILPLEVGLNLRALVDGETFYAPDVLRVDLDALRARVAGAHRLALGVALDLAWTTPETTPLLVGRAHRIALAVALEIGDISKVTLPHLVGRAVRQAKAVAELGGN